MERDREQCAVHPRALYAVAAVLGVCAIGLTGCPSFSTLQTTRTVPKGKARVALGPSAVGASSGGTVALPQVEAAVRYGITDDMDLGAKLYMFGVEGGLKYQLLRGDFDLAIAPALAYSSFELETSNDNGDNASGGLRFIYVHLPVLMGKPLVTEESFGLDVNFGPKLLFATVLGEGSASSGSDGGTVRDAASGLLGGAYVSLPIRVGSAFWFAPEINLYTNLQSSEIDGAAFDVLLFQGGLGIYFGGGE